MARDQKTVFAQGVADRFWSHVQKRSDDECWEWKAARFNFGYGAFGIGHVAWYAHRVAWILTRGIIPEGLYVCHRCDNRICCNPDHCFLGTHLDNATDRTVKGRGARGERMGCAKLSESQVIEIRQSNGLHREIAEKFGVSPALISSIKARKAWSHVA